MMALFWPRVTPLTPAQGAAWFQELCDLSGDQLELGLRRWARAPRAFPPSMGEWREEVAAAERELVQQRAGPAAPARRDKRDMSFERMRLGVALCRQVATGEIRPPC